MAGKKDNKSSGEYSQGDGGLSLLMTPNATSSKLPPTEAISFFQILRSVRKSHLREVTDGISWLKVHETPSVVIHSFSAWSARWRSTHLRGVTTKPSGPSLKTHRYALDGTQSLQRWMRKKSTPSLMCWEPRVPTDRWFMRAPICPI